MNPEKHLLNEQPTRLQVNTGLTECRNCNAMNSRINYNSIGHLGTLEDVEKRDEESEKGT
jgi:hypothetical protein